MSTHTSDQLKIELPSGTEFLTSVSLADSRCFNETLKDIPELGFSAPASFDALGSTLSLLYSEASCLHGCPGGDHFWQKMTARIVSHALASIRLFTAGYYDESLSLTRGIGEIANLLFLFIAKPELVESWRNGDGKYRKKNFGPVKVRCAIEDLGFLPPVDESRYSLLCETGVHVVPALSPQAFDSNSRSSLGAAYKETEFMASLNELSFAIAESAGCLGALPFVGNRGTPILASAQFLLNVIGDLNLSIAKGDITNGA